MAIYSVKSDGINKVITLFNPLEKRGDYVVSQIIGIVGFIFLGISNLTKTRKKIILFQILSCFTFSIHYFLINALTASILNLIGVFRGIMFYNKKQENNKYKLYFIGYILLYLVVGIITYNNFFSIFPIVAYILYTISVFNEKEINMKIINLTISFMWIVYDISYMSYGGIISDILMIFTGIIGIVILKRNKGGNPNE